MTKVTDRATAEHYVWGGVSDGSATLELETGPVTFGTGQGVHVPPGMPHRLANRSDAPVEFLVVSSPSTTGDRTNLDAPA